MRRVAAAALCALALLAGGVDARRHGAGMQAGVGEVVLPSAAPAVVEASTAVVAQESKALLFQAAAVPQGEVADVLSPNGWVLYKQCGGPWANDLLGNYGGLTVCQAGCAMTSVAMLKASRGVNVNPGSLNVWLRNNGGYVQGNLIVWAAADALGGPRFNRYFGGYGSMSQGALQNSVAAGQGVIVNVRNGGHWVLVTGYAGGSTFYVNDSGFASTTYTYGEMGNFILYI